MADKLLKSITFPDLTDKYIIGDTSLSVAGAGADAKATGDALATKANTDGSYANMTVGNAEQLVSNVRVNDQTPYVFRTSGGSVDIGDREYVNGITGVSLPWNQLIFNGDFSNNDTGWNPTTHTSISVSNGVLKATCTSDGEVAISPSSNIKTFSNRRYLVKAIVRSSGKQVVISTAFSGTEPKTTSANFTEVSAVMTRTSDFIGKYPRILMQGATVGDWFEVSDFMLIDLTQLFGSTIADYIYSLEQANAGAGVAWFKKLFNKPYYAYDAGTLKHVEGLVSHDMNGFNQWDEEWEVGGLNINNGDNYPSTTAIRSKNYIPILGDTTYYFKSVQGGAMSICYYDSNKAFISAVNSGGVNLTRQTPTNAQYMRFAAIGYGTTYNNDICINLHWDGSRDGEYEPYVKHSYSLDSSVVLRGVPKLDANNELYYDGDVYEADGTVTRKYGVVDLGTLTWNPASSEGRAYSVSLSSLIRKGSPTQGYGNQVISTMFIGAEASSMAQLSDGKMSVDNAGNLQICKTSFASYTTVQLQTAMSGVYLVYELATPTTESADPYQQVQIVNDFGTEEYVLDDSAFPIPVGHDTDYPVNLVAKLEMAPNSPEGNGDYIVRQVDGENSYVPLIIEDALPTIPSTEGTYKLTVTVADGTDPVLSWEA